MSWLGPNDGARTPGTGKFRNLNFVNTMSARAPCLVPALTKRWFTIVVIMLRAHVLSIACLSSVSRVLGFVIQARDIFCHKKWPHIIFMNVVILRWPELYYHHGIPFSSSWLLCRQECGECGGMNINWAQIILCWVLMFENWTILLMPRSEWCMLCK